MISKFGICHDEITNDSNRLSWPLLYQGTKNSTSFTISKTNDKERHIKDSSSLGTKSSISLERVLCPDDAKVMQKANQIVMYVFIYILLVVEV